MTKLENKNIHYIICGKGKLLNKLKTLAKELQVDDKISFLGFRKDIIEITKVSDIFIFPSLQEGLPVALMEAMASGLPVICSNIRGNEDLIIDEKGGYLIEPYDVDRFAEKINSLIENKELIEKFKNNNLSEIKLFDTFEVGLRMRQIYSLR